MPEEELESLWLYGEMEPWRRGRIILLSIAAFYVAIHSFVFFGLLFGGRIELATSFAIFFVVWWLLFAFIWFGTHWIRWLLGAVTLLNGFAFFIWGIRDGSVIQWSSGVLDLLIGAFLFAPSVHFFAVRQKEKIRWPEKLIVAAVFFVLAASFFIALAGMNLYRLSAQREAERYGSNAMQKIFGESDTTFLLDEASEGWRKGGRLSVTKPLTVKFLRLGNVQNIRLTRVELQSIYKYPAQINYAGNAFGEGVANCGNVQLRLQIERTANDWRIAGFWWQCR